MKTKKEISEILRQYKYLGDIIAEYNFDYESFKKDLISIRPEIESDFISSSEDIKCSCTQTIKNDVHMYPDIYVECFLNFLEREKIVFDLEQFNKSIETPFSGKVAKTKISEWKDFCEEINSMGANYKSFSVVKEGDDVYVFFI